MKKCLVKDCDGSYEQKTVGYRRLKRSCTTVLTEEEYLALESKKGYIKVISDNCNVCNDSLAKRLAAYVTTGSLQCLS